MKPRQMNEYNFKGEKMKYYVLCISGMLKRYLHTAYPYYAYENICCSKLDDAIQLAEQY